MRNILGKSFNDDSPLFLQIKARVEEQILQGVLKEEDQIPSTTQIVAHYKINHITVAKGINILVDMGIIYKKRGLGMFVAAGAREKILAERAENFVTDFIEPLVGEAKNLSIPKDQLIEQIEEVFKK